jgi:hypothetical protein
MVTCNGTQIDPCTDSNNCGATGTCTGNPAQGQDCYAMGITGEYTCQNGTCQLAPCNPTTNVNCGGTCIDPSTYNGHCGAGPNCSTNPGADCGGAGSCSGGQCVCTAPEIACASGCIDPANSTTNCGASAPCATNPGLSCGTGETCNGTSCVCPGVVCGGTCHVNDASNCGACGHSCQGGYCSGGLCGPVALYTGPTEYAPPHSYLAADGAGIFFQTAVSGVNGIYTCGPTSCGTAPTLVESPGGSSLATQNGNLYFNVSNVTDVLSESSTMQTTAPAFSDGSSLGLASDVDNIYTLFGGAVYFAPITGTPPVTANPAITITGGYVGAIASDGTNLFAADSTLKQVVSCPTTALGCTTGTYTTVASGLPTAVNNVYSDGTNVWFSTTAALYKCSISAGCVLPLTPFYTVANITSITVDTTNNQVYWASSSVGAVERCSTAGSTCLGPTGAGAASYASFAQNSKAVYYSDWEGASSPKNAIYMIIK